MVTIPQGKRNTVMKANVLLDGDFKGHFLIIENDTNRLTSQGDDVNMEQVNLFHRYDADSMWREVTVWDCAEWREPGNEAFEAIMGVVAKIAANVEIKR